MPIVEIATAPCSETYHSQGPASLGDSGDMLLSAGALGVYAGLEEEDKTTLYLVVVWDKLEDYQAMVGNPTLYSKLVEAVKPAITGPISEKLLVQLDPSPASPLNAPVTTFARIFALQDGKTGADLEVLVRPHLSPTPTHPHGASFGKVLDRDEYMIASGWDSVGELHRLVAGDEKMRAAWEQVKEPVAQDKIIHVSLKPWKKYE